MTLLEQWVQLVIALVTSPVRFLYGLLLARPAPPSLKDTDEALRNTSRCLRASDPAACTTACLWLVQLVVLDGQGQCVLHSGVVHALLRAMPGWHSEPTLLAGGLAVVRALAKHTILDEDEAKGLASTALEIVVQALIRHPAHGPVQQQGSACLGALSLTWMDTAQLIEEGAIQLLAKAMRRHLSDKGVVSSAAFSLSLFLLSAEQAQQDMPLPATDPACSASHRVAEVFVRAQGVEAVIAALRQYRGHPAVQEQLCGLLSCLCVHHGATSHLAGSGCIEALLVTVAHEALTLPADREICTALQEEGCEALGELLAVSPTAVRQRLVEAGAPSAITRAMLQCPRNRRVQDGGWRALHALEGVTAADLPQVRSVATLRQASGLEVACEDPSMMETGDPSNMETVDASREAGPATGLRSRPPRPPKVRTSLAASTNGTAATNPQFLKAQDRQGSVAAEATLEVEESEKQSPSCPAQASEGAETSPTLIFERVASLDSSGSELCSLHSLRASQPATPTLM